MPDDATIGVWLAAICTLAVYSLLYRENVVFRFFEHVLIGLGTGYGAYYVITTVLQPRWYDPTFHGGAWYGIFALLTSALFYTIYSRRYAWMARLGMGIMIGAGAGLGLVGFVTEIMPQLSASMKPLNTVNNAIFLLTMLAVMSYFFFSRAHGKGLAISSRVGRYLLMVAFGAIFGNTVMARMSLFIDRLEFLLLGWGPQVLALWHRLF